MDKCSGGAQLTFAVVAEDGGQRHGDLVVRAPPAFLLHAQGDREGKDVLLALHIRKGQQSLGQGKQLDNPGRRQLDLLPGRGACAGRCLDELDGAAAEEALALALGISGGVAVKQAEGAGALLLLEQLRLRGEQSRHGAGRGGDGGGRVRRRCWFRELLPLTRVLHGPRKIPGRLARQRAQ